MEVIPVDGAKGAKGAKAFNTYSLEITDENDPDFNVFLLKQASDVFELQQSLANRFKNIPRFARKQGRKKPYQRCGSAVCAGGLCEGGGVKGVMTKGRKVS